MQAEFNIAPGGFIEADGYTYTRHDVFEEMDHPDFANRFIYHQRIWKSPQILSLLETNTVNLKVIAEEFKPFLHNPDFDLFFSPYFAGPFVYLSRTFLTGLQLKEMGILLAYEDFLQPAEREEAFRPIRLFLDETIRVLRNVNGLNYSIMRPQIVHWVQTEWHLFFNNLPHEFYEEKNDIVARLVNIGVAVQKTHRKDCVKTSKQLILLQDVTEDLRSIIIANHAVYSSPRRVRSVGTGSGWAVGIVFFMLIRLFTTGSCNGNYSGYTPGYSPIQYLPPDSTILIVSDSEFMAADTAHFIKRSQKPLKRKKLFPEKAPADSLPKGP